MEKSRYHRFVEVLDTTLRDGEQTPGVAFTPAEKLQIARVLAAKLHVDRLEIGSARVSEGERQGVVGIFEWAAGRGILDAMEMLGFVDGGKSADWICQSGGRVMNLLTKGSEAHCRVQLRLTPEQHWEQIARDVEYAAGKGLTVNVYLEDWSNGMRDSFPYVYNMLRVLQKLPVSRIMLCDTLGVLRPAELRRYLDWLYAGFGDGLRFDFHGHNDYGLVTANSLAAVELGVAGVHTTINGLGERTGNQPLAELVIAVNDMTDRKCRTSEKMLYHASVLVQTVSGKRTSWNTPVVGSDVFTQTCGVHADGDKKGNLYANKLAPERFARQRDYALGKLSGKASLDKNLEALGLELDEEARRKVLQEIVRLGDKKKQVTQSDLPFVIGAALRTPVEEVVKIVDYSVVTAAKSAPKAEVTVSCDGREVSASARGDGGYDAMMLALRKALKEFGMTLPKLLDYEVRIPPGGKSDALVETTITWEGRGGMNLVTTGVDCDQIAAAVLATEKMMNLVFGREAGETDRCAKCSRV